MVGEDVRLDQATAHPLNAKDCERSAARLADIELGLTGPDRAYWLNKAQHRLTMLAEDDHDFGLVPHEEAELNALIELVNKHG